MSKKCQNCGDLMDNKQWGNDSLCCCCEATEERTEEQKEQEENK